MRKLNTAEDEVNFTTRSPLGGADEETRRRVRRILEDIKAHGWEAVVKYSRRFDDVPPRARPAAESELKEAWEELPANNQEALRHACRRIKRYQEKLIETSTAITDGKGGLLGNIVRPVQTAGCYIPGGRVPMPSSVLMSAYVAEVAGVENIVICSPPGDDGRPHPSILAAAYLLDDVEVYGAGGVQAVGAMAYGAGSVPKADVVAGPGNIYVTLAKKEVFGEVDIDMLAGPSELAVVADSTADPEFVACDLLSQAEHDPRSRVYLFTPDKNIRLEVEKSIEDKLVSHPREKVIDRALTESALILTAGLDEAVELVNELAPEHLELMTENAIKLSRRCVNAGAIFCGPWSPEPVGDYIAGPSHTLPTGGSARFFSPLSVKTFLRHQSLISLSRDGFENVRDQTETIARMEYLPAHEESSAVRGSEN